MVQLSIVTPCLNEADNVEKCIKETLLAINDFDSSIKFEHIFIDNNSTDQTVKRLVKLKNKYTHLRILVNSQNVGAFSSIQRGMSAAKGEWIVPFLAADCQDPPNVIPKMIELQRSTKCDSVFAIRETRAEGILMLSMRRIFYSILKRLSSSNFKAGVSEFCLIQKKSSIKLTQIDDPNPFLRIYLSQLPGDVQYLPFHMKARIAGKSSANIFNLVDDALNAFSILLPSIYSRTLIFSSISGLFGITFFLVGLVMQFNGLERGLLVAIFGAFSTITAGLFGLLATIGHYVFIIHNQIRQRILVETKEV